MNVDFVWNSESVCFAKEEMSLLVAETFILVLIRVVL
jgi:hypothetical protein